MAKRTATTITLLVLVALAASACTSTKTGDPTTGNGSTTTTQSATTGTNTPPSATASDPLANTDPCTLMPAAVLSQNQLQPNKSGNELGARFCRWSHIADSSGSGYDVSINIYDHAGQDQLNTNNFTIMDFPLKHHPGKLAQAKVLHTCTVSIGITSTSRVDIIGTDGAGQLEAACTIAKLVGPAVENQLPAGS
jgi:hypothetical protein